MRSKSSAMSFGCYCTKVILGNILSRWASLQAIDAKAINVDTLLSCLRWKRPNEYRLSYEKMLHNLVSISWWGFSSVRWRHWSRMIACIIFHIPKIFFIQQNESFFFRMSAAISSSVYGLVDWRLLTANCMSRLAGRRAARPSSWLCGTPLKTSWRQRWQRWHSPKTGSVASLKRADILFAVAPKPSSNQRF